MRPRPAPPLDIEKIARMLQLAREMRGLSLHGAYLRSHVHPATIREIEHGQKTVGRLMTVADLAAGYGLRLSELIRRCERGNS